MPLRDNVYVDSRGLEVPDDGLVGSGCGLLESYLSTVLGLFNL